MIDIYAIKTDGLRYYTAQCQDNDETVEAVLRLLAREQQAHRDTVRFDLVRQIPDTDCKGE